MVFISNNSTTNSLHHESIQYEDYDYLQIHEISSKSSLSTIKSLLFYTKKAGLDSPTFKHVIKNYLRVLQIFGIYAVYNQKLSSN